MTCPTAFPRFWSAWSCAPCSGVGGPPLAATSRPIASVAMIVGRTMLRPSENAAIPQSAPIVSEMPCADVIQSPLESARDPPVHQEPGQDRQSGRAEHPVHEPLLSGEVGHERTRRRADLACRRLEEQDRRERRAHPEHAGEDVQDPQHDHVRVHPADLRSVVSRGR